MKGRGMIAMNACFLCIGCLVYVLDPRRDVGNPVNTSFAPRCYIVMDVKYARIHQISLPSSHKQADVRAGRVVTLFRIILVVSRGNCSLEIDRRGEAEGV
jgi:hypothetical protein